MPIAIIKLAVPSEILDRFVWRTHNHIKRVNDNARILENKFPELYGLTQNCAWHDYLKLRSPEVIPYCWLTEYHRCQDNDIEFEYPEGVEQQVLKATEHHILNSDHHPEYYCPNPETIKIGKNRDDWIQPSGIVDALEMPPMAMAEMCADWAAMSQEKKSSVHEWAKKNVNKRWKFSPQQEKFIYTCLSKLE